MKADAMNCIWFTFGIFVVVPFRFFFSHELTLIFFYFSRNCFQYRRPTGTLGRWTYARTRTHTIRNNLRLFTEFFYNMVSLSIYIIKFKIFFRCFPIEMRCVFTFRRTFRQPDLHSVGNGTKKGKIQKKKSILISTRESFLIYWMTKNIKCSRKF